MVRQLNPKAVFETALEQVVGGKLEPLLEALDQLDREERIRNL